MFARIMKTQGQVSVSSHTKYHIFPDSCQSLQLAKRCSHTLQFNQNRPFCFFRQLLKGTAIRYASLFFNQLVVILFILKAAIKRVQCLARLSIVEREQARPKVRDILMIDATHHHMKYPCARFLPRLPRHACITDPFIPSV